MEGDAADTIIAEVEGLLKVPGDRLAFAVRVGGEIDDTGLGSGPLELADRLFLGRNDFVRRLVALGDVEAELALGQVAHMAHAGFDDIGRAKKLVDRLGLLGAFDDHQGGPGAIGGGFGIFGRISSRTALLVRGPFGAALRLAAGFLGSVSSARGVVCFVLRATVLAYLSYSQNTASVDPRCVEHGTSNGRLRLFSRQILLRLR